MHEITSRVPASSTSGRGRGDAASNGLRKKEGGLFSFAQGGVSLRKKRNPADITRETAGSAGYFQNDMEYRAPREGGSMLRKYPAGTAIVISYS